MSIPNADNRYFFLSGFFNNTPYNGSLWNAVNDTIFPFAASDPGIELNLLPNNNIQLSFVDNGQNMWTAMPAITQLLAANVTRGLITCTYPLSGQYDHLPRILFYVAAIFAILGRHLTWVAEAALGIIIAYSATAAFHLFVLLGLYRFRITYTDDIPSDVIDARNFGDIDFFGIAPVVSLTVVLLTPMLHWSETFRSHSAKIVIQCWAVFMFAASIAFLTLIREYGNDWDFDQVLSMAYCTSTDASCQPIGTPESDGLPYFENKEKFNRCQCTDLCALLAPTAPLRGGTSMVPFLSYSATDAILFGKKGIADRLGYIETALFALWIFAIIQGISALLGSNSTQEAIRNRIFRVLYGDIYSTACYFFKGVRRDRILAKYYIAAPRKTTVYWSFRRFAAKLVAGTVYLLRIFGVILYPLLFVSTLAFCELFASAMPVSEPSSALGAWSAWVGAALVVLSAIILAVYPALCRSFERFTFWVQYDASDRPRLVEDEKAKTVAKPRASMADWKKHAMFNVVHFVWRQKQIRRRFVAWWADPVAHSYPEKYGVDGDSMIEPECGCVRCKPADGGARWQMGNRDVVGRDDVQRRKESFNKEWQ